MRSPSKTIITNRSVRDAESELNLPPGFRFHPTDEELIVHYLCRKSQSMSGTATTTVPPPLSIIADVDLYKHEPWELPEMAWFGTKEWYFFTPRDKKYPNGSRPNRVTGNGYWKATGADKPIKSKADPNTTVGIKKALVFYSGKGSKGIKTNWIMHEYRLTNVATTSSSKLNNWVLCRLYNKKNNPKEMIIPNDANIHQIGHDTRPTSSPLDELQKGTSYSNNSDSLNSFEYSDDGFSGSFDGDVISHESSHKPLTKVEGTSKQQSNLGVMGNLMKFEDNNNDGNDWFDSLSLEDLHNCLEAMPPNHDIYELPMFYCPNQQHFPD